MSLLIVVHKCHVIKIACVLEMMQLLQHHLNSHHLDLWLPKQGENFDISIESILVLHYFPASQVTKQQMYVLLKQEQLNL